MERDMMRNLSLVLLMSAVACSDKEDGSGGDTGTTGGGGGGGGGANIADYINVTDAPVGNLSLLQCRRWPGYRVGRSRLCG